MKIYHSISIDLTRDSACVSVPTISGTEGDSGTHVLEIRLTSDGKDWPVPEDVTAVICYARPDGTGGTYDSLPDGTPAWYVKDSLVYVELAPACFAAATNPWEELWLTVTLLRGDSQITTRRIPLIVRRSLVYDGEETGIYVSFASVIRQVIGDTDQLNTENTGSIVDAVNEALEKCENSVVSVQTLRVSEDHELLITLTNGKVLNAGRVLVPGSVGGVSTVAGLAPDENGDVPILAEDIGALPLEGATMLGPISMDNFRITELGDPVNDADAVTKRWVDRRMSSRNLLDNWYFKNAINQRMSESYYQAGPAFDRWVATDEIEASVSSTGLSLYCQSANTGMGQCLEDPAALNGCTVTASAHVIDNTGDFHVSLLHIRDGVETALCQAISGSTGIVTATCTLASDCVQTGDQLLFRIGNGDTAGQGYAVTAVKLELGAQQTLARKENNVWILSESPDYATELFRCQRFLQVFRTQSLRPTYAEDFRPPMRQAPSLGSIVRSGVTYYTASAEL